VNYAASSGASIRAIGELPAIIGPTQQLNEEAMTTKNPTSIRTGEPPRETDPLHRRVHHRLLRRATAGHQQTRPLRFLHPTRPRSPGCGNPPRTARLPSPRPYGLQPAPHYLPLGLSPIAVPCLPVSHYLTPNPLLPLSRALAPLLSLTPSGAGGRIRLQAHRRIARTSGRAARIRPA